MVERKIMLLHWKDVVWSSLRETFALLGFFWFSGQAADRVFGDIPAVALVAVQLAAVVLASRWANGRWYWWAFLRRSRVRAASAASVGTTEKVRHG